MTRCGNEAPLFVAMHATAPGQTCYTQSVILGLGVSPMRRREFITLLGGMTAWPLAARAQQATKLPTIGYLGTAGASAWAPWTAAFVQRLHELGWTDRSDRRDPISLGGGTRRALGRAGRRIGPAQGARHRH